MLRRYAMILISMVSVQVCADGFDFLPAKSGMEKEFQAFLSAGNYRQALMTWETAHGNSPFGRSQTGAATYAYLLHQNGLSYMAVDALFATTSPKNLNPQLMSLWSTELKNLPLVQKGWIKPPKAWSSVVVNQPPSLRLNNKKQIHAAFRRAHKLGSEHVNQKARIWWQIATRAPIAGEVDQSLKALKLLKESGQTVIGTDLIQSAYARALFQKGDIEAALNAYSQIPKSSSLWVESVEEKAWAHLRRDDFDKALGEVTTLLSPALSPLIGPESYYLANLLALKVCDYPRVFKNSATFKKTHRERLDDLQQLASSGTYKNLGEVLSRFRKSGVKIESAGPLVASVPRTAFRDAKFVQYMESVRLLDSEIDKANSLAGAATALGGGHQIELRITEARAKVDVFTTLASKRIRTLAKAELNEYRKNLNRMHIVEAEVIQRLHVDESLKGKRSKLSKAEDKGDVLIFPYTSNEVWFDELGNYKAQVKDCPTLKEASL